MKKPKTPAATIVWQELPLFATRLGYVGTPYDRDGNAHTQTSFHVYSHGEPERGLWGQFSAMHIVCNDPWEFAIDGEPTPDVEVAKMRCLLNWLETLDDLAG